MSFISFNFDPQIAAGVRELGVAIERRRGS